jgi:hypothetical protein
VLFTQIIYFYHILSHFSIEPYCIPILAPLDLKSGPPENSGRKLFSPSCSTCSVPSKTAWSLNYCISCAFYTNNLFLSHFSIEPYCIPSYAWPHFETYSKRALQDSSSKTSSKLPPPSVCSTLALRELFENTSRTLREHFVYSSYEMEIFENTTSSLPRYYYWNSNSLRELFENIYTTELCLGNSIYYIEFATRARY